MENRKIEVYIDGSSVDVNACKNKRVMSGGWPVEPEWHGAYAGVFLVDGVEVLRMKGYEKGGTIGKMELSALVCGLQALLDQRVLNQMHLYVTIYSDSQYVVNGATKWWRGWKKKNYKDIKFRDLWSTYTVQLLGFVKLDICWIKGHNGSAGNEIADKLANEALGAGITGWKVSGKERFLLFDKVEGFMKSPNTGDILPVHYIHEEAGPFPVMTEEMKNSPLLNKSEIFTLDDNDFTDMAKKKPDTTKFPVNYGDGKIRELEIPNRLLEKSEEDDSEDYYQAIADYRKAHPVKDETKAYPTWYEEQIAKHKELVKRQTKEFNQMMDRYAKHVEGIIYELKIEQEKQDGTRSTKSNP